jgi:hypothetical protein
MFDAKLLTPPFCAPPLQFKKKVVEVVASRGRKNTELAELLRQLQHLAYVGKS